MPEQGLMTRAGRIGGFNNRIPAISGANAKVAQSTAQLEGLSQQFGELGDLARKKKVQSDIITARLAVEMERQMPGGLEPEAELHFDKLTAENSANSFITQFTLDNDARSSLILKNENGDSPEQLQELYETQLDDGMNRFIKESEFSGHQIAHVAPLLDTYKTTARKAFTQTLVKNIDDTKTAEGNETIKGSIENNIVLHNELESVGEDSDLTTLFSAKWHTDLRANLMEALPYFNRDEVDELIVENLSQIASDPDDPQPDILEYLDKPQPGERFRFSSVKGLGTKIAAAQRKARQALIASEKSRATQETQILKAKRDQADGNASDYVTLQFEQGTAASKDLELLMRNVQRLFPDLDPADARAISTNANQRLNSKSSSLSSQANSAGLIADIQNGDFPNFATVQADSRYNELGGKQYEDVFSTFNEFKKGKIQNGQTVRTQQRGMLRKSLEAAVTQRLDPENPEKFIHPLTGAIINLPLDEQERINNIVSQYDLQAANTIQRFSDDPNKIDDALFKLRTDMMKGMQLSEVGAEDFGADTSPDEKIKELAPRAPEKPSEVPESTPAKPKAVGGETEAEPDQGTSSSEISARNADYIPTEHVKTVNLPARPLPMQAEIKKSISALQGPPEFDPNVDIGSDATTFLRVDDPEQQKIIDATVKTMSDAGEALSKGLAESPEVFSQGISNAIDSLVNLGDQLSDEVGAAARTIGKTLLENVVNPIVSSGATPAFGFVDSQASLGDNSESEPSEEFQANGVNEVDITDLGQFTAGNPRAAGEDPRIKEGFFAEDRFAKEALDSIQTLDDVGVSTQIVGKKRIKKSRGLRNNNPGNIRISKIKWNGMAKDQPDKSFVKFETPQKGIRAMHKILQTYNKKHKITTIEGIISRWAPPVENDTKAYIQSVVQTSGIPATRKLNFSDAKEMSQVMKGIIKHENASQPFSDAEIIEGIKEK